MGNFNCIYKNTSRTRLHHEASLLKLHDEMKVIAQSRSGAYDTPLHSIRLPHDPHILIDAKQCAERYYSSRLKYIVVVGIGGSNLGTQAVYDALRGKLDFVTRNQPKIIFLDTVSTNYLHDLLDLLTHEVKSREEILINVISKSGSTTESIANFEFLMASLMKNISGVEERVVVTTNYGSPLWISAQERGYGQLAIPESVGGRYSVFTHVGIFPLLLAGIDVVELLKGAQYMLEKNFGSNTDEHFARHNAEVIYGEMKRGVSILNIFHFNPELESLGKWERQLTAESLGKESDRSGREIHAGITPIVSIGSTDLHSMAQLYFGGPKDKFTMLIKSPEPSTRHIPNAMLLADAHSGIKGSSPHSIMNAIYGGVVGAYQKLELPFAEVCLPSISAFSLGMYLEWRMLSVIYLAELMHVNPFDQPAVEHYKDKTRALLGAK